MNLLKLIWNKRKNIFSILMKIIPIFLSILIIISPILVYLHYFRKNEISLIPSEWGNFGDFSGGTIGTILTAITLFYVAISYKNQVQSNYKSAFESTFFNMIDFHHKLVEQLVTNNKNNLIQGRRALNYLYTLLEQEIEKTFISNINFKNINPTILQTQIELNYKKLYNEKLYEIGHYFRHQYHIYKFVENSKLTDEEKKQYAKTFRSQLTGFEMVLIGINCLTTYGVKFKPLVEKYALLHNLMNDNYFRKAFILLYDKSAFGKEDITKTLPLDDQLTKILF